MESQGTFVKICGMTRLTDVRAAVRSGAGAVGFVFASSPRRVSPARALELRRHVHPAVSAFGVFVNAELARVIEIIDQVGLDGVQLQGDESPQFVAELKRLRPTASVFKVIRTNRPEDLSAIGDYAADGFFVDSKDPSRPLDRIGVIPAQWLKGVPVEQLVVAGGLNPSNVGELVRKLHPWGVDVSAGVEAGPGKKDPSLIRAFIMAVREAEV